MKYFEFIRVPGRYDQQPSNSGNRSPQQNTPGNVLHHNQLGYEGIMFHHQREPMMDLAKAKVIIGSYFWDIGMFMSIN